MENATVDFKEITDIDLLNCECEALVESRLSNDVVATVRKWVVYRRRGKPRTFRVNVAQITHVRRFSVPTGRIEIRKNPFYRCCFDFFVPKTAEFFVDEGALDVIKVKTADGTTFDADASAAPEWLKAIAPAEAKNEG